MSADFSDSPYYRGCFAAKCAISAVFTAAVAVWCMFSMEHPLEAAAVFTPYFVFDVVADAALDKIWRPRRRNFEFAMLVHHVVGIAAMYHMPPHELCITVCRLVTVAELSTPLLYLANYYRFVRMREAPLAVSSAMLVAWPILRLASPSVGFVLQVQAYYGGSAEHCGVHNLFITLGYIAMNAYFLTLIWRRHQRNRMSAKAE